MAQHLPTYWDYIRIEELLELQGGIERDSSRLSNDEVMFITVHQVDELWFKLVLREIVTVRDLFAQDRVPEQAVASGVRGARRIVLLLKLATQQFELMETMTTRDYLAFRDKLSPASGFQSAQMREIEILMGLRASDRISFGQFDYLEALKYADGTESPAYLRVKRRLEDSPTLATAISNWLFRTPIDGAVPADDDDEERVGAFVDRYLDAHRSEVDAVRAHALRAARSEGDIERLNGRFDREIASTAAFLRAEDTDEEERSHRRRVRAALVFIEGYRELPLLAWPREVVDTMVAMEQAFVVFRQRHARMVERVVGRRTGTGGSAGVDYLDQTAQKYRVFHDIWAVRTLQIRAHALPPLANPAMYGLRAED